MHGVRRNAPIAKDKEVIMKKALILATALGLTCALGIAPAEAQSRETVTTTGPNRELLRGGLFTFGVPYAASVVVAATSHRSEDKHLYIPVAGPWLDFANRSACGGPTQPSCELETAYKVLLAGDGILQGIGALQIVGSFFFPETRTVTVKRARPFFLTPARVGSGYGLSAAGSF
jgi:hypothetical protein